MLTLKKEDKMKFTKKIGVIFTLILVISTSSLASMAEETGKEVNYFTELTTLIGEVMFYNYSFLNPIYTSSVQKGMDSQNAVLLLSSILASNSSLQKRWKKLVPQNKTKEADPINNIFNLTDGCVKSLIDYLNYSNKDKLAKYQKFYTSLDSEINKLLKEKE